MHRDRRAEYGTPRGNDLVRRFIRGVRNRTLWNSLRMRLPRRFGAHLERLPGLVSLKQQTARPRHYGGLPEQTGGGGFAPSGHVLTAPVPLDARFSPVGFDVATRTRFAMISTTERTVRPSGIEGQQAKAFRIRSVEELQSQPDRWRWQMQKFPGLLDHPRNHDDPRLRAGVLSHAAAVGLPVCLQDDSGLSGLLPEAIVDLWRSTTPADLLDPYRREQIAFRQWSLVHDRLAVRSVGAGPPPADDQEGVRGRSLSVLVATRRPEMVENWAPQLAAQDHPDFEVVAAFHGDEFTTEDEARARRWLGDRLTVVRVSDSVIFGDVLNRAVEASCGDLLVKWDDDDLYSTGHLSDLVRIHRYSGATLSGKALEYVYLARENITARVATGPTERFGVVPAGNTMCLLREDLKQVGGWAPVTVGEDSRLAADVSRQGGSIYRGSGFGHVVIRVGDTGHRHTWQVSEDDLKGQSELTRPGLDSSFALVDAPAGVLERWTWSPAAAEPIQRVA